ncbi:nascent polypeptide-associated complex subunit alpha-like protein 2 [Dorcoceras hygrometricum]|uniref:Nascent polypeptide-associated complex subunit alpha-like protein 2 n=1 Tax=Dorcoceras hygrometricum TaxID=472368 RepID=A0A2Z7CKN7_9LAMI|nr:nascent polypeptide-associated complex subunit alpha-like protein 2 [Dorcoceras hygrometricum]
MEKNRLDTFKSRFSEFDRLDLDKRGIIGNLTSDLQPCASLELCEGRTEKAKRSFGSCYSRSPVELRFVSGMSAGSRTLDSSLRDCLVVRTILSKVCYWKPVEGVFQIKSTVTAPNSTMPGPVVEETEARNKIQDEPLVEDLKEDDDHEDDAEDSDDEDEDKDGSPGSIEGSRQSRSEKKSRKAMLKLGMKPVPGIMFFISKPDVFKNPNSETYIIFGEAKIEDLSSQLQTQAAQQFRMPDMSSVMAKSEIAATAANAQADEEEEDVDETGVEPRDVDLVMTQAGVSKAKAVKALKTHCGDIVSAIMELTT